MTDELIAEATGFAETDDEEILGARKMFAERMAKHREVTSAEAEKVRELGGLYILGTERHESRRIDNQLRGRAGRQGDPGETKFYIAMTDDIMRLFGSERVMGMMDSLGFDEDTPIDKKMLSNAIESSQRRVESRNFQARKSVLEYDDVMNTQRTLIYKQRQTVLDGEDIQQNIKTMVSETIENTVNSGLAEAEIVDEQSVLKEILTPLEALFLRKGEIRLKDGGYTKDALLSLLEEKAFAFYAEREREFGFAPNSDVPIMRELERVVMLRVVDEYWMQHIDGMEELRDSVRLRAYGQINPIDEYKREGFDMFESMVDGIKEEIVRRIFTVRIKKEESLQRRSVARGARASAQNVGGDSSSRSMPVKKGAKIGRNEPCPCGKLRPNGLHMKYKDCCGRGA